MRASDINKKGKKEKGQKVKAGECIFPFKYQWKEHNECFETEKGDICATSVSDRGTLKTYGYCEKPKSKSPLKITAKSRSKSKSKESLKKGTEKKALKKTLKKKKKLVIVDKFSASKSRSKTRSKSPLKEEKLKSKSPIKIEETIEMDLKPSPKGKPMNKELIDIMEELADIMMRQGEPFKARAYKKSI